MLQDKVEQIIKEVAEDNNVDEVKLKEAFLFTFKTVKKLLQTDNYPSVLIHNFGKFYVSYRKISNNIMYHIKGYRENKLTREEFLERFHPSWKARRRIQAEYLKRHKHNLTKKRKKWQ